MTVLRLDALCFCRASISKEAALSATAPARDPREINPKDGLTICNGVRSHSQSWADAIIIDIDDFFRYTVQQKRHRDAIHEGRHAHRSTCYT